MLSPDFNIDKVFEAKKNTDWESSYRTIGFIENERYFLCLKKSENNNLITECRIGISENTCLTILFHSFLLTKDIKEVISKWAKEEFEKLEDEHNKLKRLGFKSNKAEDRYLLELGNWRIEIRRGNEEHIIETQERLDLSFNKYYRTMLETHSKEEITRAIHDHFSEDMDLSMFPYMNDELRDLILKNE